MLKFSIPTFVFVAINLLILYFSLKKFLFKPITEFMEKRENSIRDSINKADRSLAEAKDLKNEYDRQLKTTKEEADNIIKEAIARGQREYEASIEQAKENAQSMLIKAREEIERERAIMLKESKNQIASLALAAASKVIQANMNNDANNELVNKFIDEEGAA